jgi:hypothetical protein
MRALFKSFPIEPKYILFEYSKYIIEFETKNEATALTTVPEIVYENPCVTKKQTNIHPYEHAIYPDISFTKHFGFILNPYLYSILTSHHKATPTVDTKVPAKTPIIPRRFIRRQETRIFTSARIGFINFVGEKIPYA